MSGSLQDLARAPSHWRVLNLFAANRLSAEEGEARIGLFDNPVLNSAILVKHNLRSNETGLFLEPAATATKVVVPLDRRNLHLGARAFFVGERHFEAYLREATGIQMDANAAVQPADVTKLQLVDRLPSLDAFLVQESMRHEGFEVQVPTDWFDGVLGRDGLSFLHRQFEPLLRLAVGNTLSAGEGERFFKDVFFDPESAKSRLMAAAMKVEPHRWAQVLFTWKASIFYEWSTRSVHTRYKAFKEDLIARKVYAGNDAISAAEIRSIRSKFLARAQGHYQTLTRFQARFNASYRERFIEGGDPTAFRDYLQTLNEDLYHFGLAYAQLEHMISYWKHAVTDRGMTSVPADYFFDVTRALAATEAA